MSSFVAQDLGRWSLKQSRQAAGKKEGGDNKPRATLPARAEVSTLTVEFIGIVG